ncbi:MAG: hypothetical protein MJ252_12490 [archaeon]|nr:hypothetical protein [archaeon]
MKKAKRNKAKETGDDAPVEEPKKSTKKSPGKKGKKKGDKKKEDKTIPKEEKEPVVDSGVNNPIMNHLLQQGKGKRPSAFMKIPGSGGDSSKSPKEIKSDPKKVLEKYVQLFSAKTSGQKVLVEINTQQQAMKEEMDKIKKMIRDTEDEVKEEEKKKDILELKDKIAEIERFLASHTKADLTAIVEENTDLEKKSKVLEKKVFTLREMLKNEEEEYNILSQNFDEMIESLQIEIDNAKLFENRLIKRIEKEGDTGDFINVINDIRDKYKVPEEPKPADTNNIEDNKLKEEVEKTEGTLKENFQLDNQKETTE